MLVDTHVSGELRHRYLDDNVLGQHALIENAFELQCHFDLSAALVRLSDSGCHLERQADSLRDPLAHQFELSVRRNERDGPLSVEFAQTHTLVELDVFDVDS